MYVLCTRISQPLLLPMATSGQMYSLKSYFTGFKGIYSVVKGSYLSRGMMAYLLWPNGPVS